MFKIDLTIINIIIIMAAAGITVSSLLLYMISEKIKLPGIVRI